MSELSWWMSPHPDWEPTEDWPEEVPVVLYEADDEGALIDPFLPPTALSIHTRLGLREGTDTGPRRDQDEHGADRNRTPKNPLLRPGK